MLQLQDNEYKEIPSIPFQHPVTRTLNILKHDFKSLVDPDLPPLLEFASHVDICIIGGGIMGSSIAYWLKQRVPREGLSITVIEKDPGVSQSRLRFRSWLIMGRAVTVTIGSFPYIIVHEVLDSSLARRTPTAVLPQREH